MNRIPRLIGDLVKENPWVLLGVVVVVAVIAGIVYYRRATLHKRLRSDARIVRRR